MVVAVSLSFTMVLHSSRAMREVVPLKSEDTFWKMICWKRLLRFLDIFYNTGMPHIFGAFNKKAGTKREGKVQLINATNCLREEEKLLGNKRNDISEKQNL